MSANLRDLNVVEFTAGAYSQNTQVNIQIDFAYANYAAKDNFFSELNRIMVEASMNDVVTTRTGMVFEMDTLAGTVSLQLYMQQVESAYQVLNNLSQLGVNLEKQMWKLGGN